MTDKIRILVVEDNPADVRLIAECFRDAPDNFQAEIENADTLESALASLDAGGADIDVIMLDLSLPDSQGLETFTAINEKAPSIPIIVLSGNENEELATKIVKLGAQESLSKDFLGVSLSDQLIRRTVRHAIERKASHEALNSMQMQLIQAEKLESIGRLAAGVAHEVRNPLARIQLVVDYLKEGINPDDPNLPMLLTRMSTAVDRADSILQEMLDFSSDRGLNLVEIDANSLIEDGLLLVSHELKSRSIKVVNEFGSGLPGVMIDSGKIEQVIINLILNAAHAMEDQEERVLRISTDLDTVDDLDSNPGGRTRERLRNGDRVVSISFEDTGGGIPAEVLEQIWEPFFTTKATGKGTGLGLSVVRKIVEIHNGQIKIENTNSGARAILKLKASDLAESS